MFDVVHVCIIVLSGLKEYGCGNKNQTTRVIQMPSLDCGVVTGFLDGAEQKGVHGDGMVIKVKMNHRFLLRMEVGK